MLLVLQCVPFFILLLHAAQSSSVPPPTTPSPTTTPAESLSDWDAPLPTNSQLTSPYVQPVKPAYSNVYKYLQNCNEQEAKLEGMIWEDHRRIAEYVSKWNTDVEGMHAAMDLYVGPNSTSAPYSDDIECRFNYNGIYSGITG